jgi:hypothetical protein
MADNSQVSCWPRAPAVMVRPALAGVTPWQEPRTPRVVASLLYRQQHDKVYLKNKLQGKVIITNQHI